MAVRSALTYTNMRTRLREVATVMQGLSRTGRSIGASGGETRVRLVSGNNIQDDRLVEEGLDDTFIDLERMGTKHLLRPYDVLITGKSTSVKAAYVPPTLDRAIANSTMVVVRPDDADLGPYLWWFVTSARGRALVESYMVRGAALSTLSPRALAEMEIPVPSSSELRQISALIQASEAAYWSGRRAADIRRTLTREAIINRLAHDGGSP